jgi:hypothetical protein
MRKLFFPLIILIVASAPASADTLRCGNKIVETGMTQDEVRQHCGNPSSTEVEEHDVRAGPRVIGTTQLHIWTYNRASGQNAAVLEFDQDTLLAITFVRK